LIDKTKEDFKVKRKDVSARILTGVLAFSMVAATGTPSMAVFAAEESAVEAEQNTGRGEE
jgi:hypothetical protein